MKKLFVFVSVSVLASCTSSAPNDATLTPTPTNTVTLGAPAPTSPHPNEQVGWLEQPLTLTVNNSTVTGTSSTPITYEFELAEDEAFTKIVFSQKGVPQGSDGRTVSGHVPILQFPTFLFWRARSLSGTAKSVDSPKVVFELEGQGGHVSPVGYDDGHGKPQNEEYALAIIEGTADEHRHLMAVFNNEAAAESAAEELLLRTIWHLKLQGFDAARQRNPSTAISKDKVNIYIRGSWRTYDIYTLGSAGQATTISGLLRVFPEDPQFNDGIPD
jgi:hypothetical protein